jgi:hypothetical protein
MKRWPLLLPFLFAVAPSLTLYASNIGEAAFSETFLPLVAMLALTALLLPLFAFAFRGSFRGAVGLSLLWWVVFSYGHVAGVIGKYSIAGHNPANPKLLVPVTAAILALGGIALKRARNEPRMLARVMLVFVIVTLAASAVTVLRAGGAPRWTIPFLVFPLGPNEARRPFLR